MTSPFRVKGWKLRLGCILALVLFFTPIAEAQKKPKRRTKKKTPVTTVKEVKKTSGGKEQVFDFTGLALGASMRTPQLLYFLDRTREELERASLKRRSFLPEMVNSIDEEGL